MGPGSATSRYVIFNFCLEVGFYAGLPVALPWTMILLNMESSLFSHGVVTSLLVDYIG